MKHLAYFLIGMWSIVSPSGIWAQTKTEKSLVKEIKDIEEKTIVGTILDENSEPLPGATVRVKGTQIGTVTDIEGNFSIQTNSQASTLIISYIGMKTQTLHLPKETKYVRIQMEPDVTLMDEVIVTGYQNIKRENATGSYQLIGGKEMDSRYTGDIASNLEGRVPGLVAVTPDPYATGEDALSIRGIGTFEARTSPLIVVDGLPIEGGLNTVNPYDIDNITVLKDAAASAIYGARASNGVIVITTKRAKEDRMSIDFNADLVISERQNYDNYNWASAADIIQLEKYNFNAMLNEDPNLIQQQIDYANNGMISNQSQVMRLLLQNYQGLLSDADLNATLDKWIRNDYRKEWQDMHDRTKINHQYNLGIRVKGKNLSSSIVVNYMGGNMGAKRENESSLTFSYNGDLKVTPWWNLSFGVNVLNNRSKTHASTSYNAMNSFMAYESMYNDDGSLKRMEADIYPGEEVLGNSLYGLKDPTYNFAEEMNYNFTKYRYTNVRTNVKTLFHLPVEGWTAQAQFQYEDITSRTQTRYDNASHFMRSLYDLYTTASQVSEWVADPNFDWDSALMDPNTDWSDPYLGMMQVINTQVNHAVPDGDLLSTGNVSSQFYTFRAQTQYTREFGLHAVDALAGFEYRQTHTTTDNDLRYGYNDQTQTNLNLLTDWAFINNPTTGVLGTNYPVFGAPSSFDTSDILHRYYSYYFTANYVYDQRYSLFGSYRVDRTDLFGADPKFRGRPLWSAGVSWNLNNESFMKPITWINALKLRASFGLTGNIDSSVSSYLTASIGTNRYNGENQGSLQTPPNDQLRWEKTKTWNVGIDFGLLDYRLNGSVDLYAKSGSDLLTNTDLDPTTGWTSLTINSGEMTNKGVELQLNGNILRARKRSQLGIDLGFNFAYNKNKVTKVSHYPESGYEYLTMSLHEDYPLNSLFSIDYAGMVEQDGTYFLGWRDKNGEVHTESVASGTFTEEDAVFSGTYTPTISGAITPEITWQGFTLSAMFNFYGGHYMRTRNDAWSSSAGSGSGYKNTFGQGELSKDLLQYWEGNTDVPANGYMSIHYTNTQYGIYRNTNVEHAGYVKLRNIVLGYNFDKRICRAIGLNDLRIRFQMNNVCTWARNSLGLDPEAVNPVNGSNYNTVPRSYTMSVYFNL